jgi:hypothetical protein
LSPVPVQVGVADVESEGPSRAACGGLFDWLPVRGAFVVSVRLCQPSCWPVTSKRHSRNTAKVPCSQMSSAPIRVFVSEDDPIEDSDSDGRPVNHCIIPPSVGALGGPVAVTRARLWLPWRCAAAPHSVAAPAWVPGSFDIAAPSQLRAAEDAFIDTPTFQARTHASWRPRARGCEAGTSPPRQYSYFAPGLTRARANFTQSIARRALAEQELAVRNPMCLARRCGASDDAPVCRKRRRRSRTQGRRRLRR